MMLTSDLSLWRSNVNENPGSILAWNNLGSAYLDRKRSDLAAESFQKAIALDPDNLLAHRNLGIPLIGLKDTKGAENSPRVSPDSSWLIGSLSFLMGPPTCGTTSKFSRIKDYLGVFGVLVVNAGRPASMALAPSV